MHSATGAQREARHARLMRCASVAVAIVVAVTGCAPSAASSAQQWQLELEQLDNARAAAHEANSARLATYLRDKWGPVPLPEATLQRWVPAVDWATTMAQCLRDAGFNGVMPGDDDQRLDFSALIVADPRVLFELDVATYVCQGRLGVRWRVAEQVRDRESAWAERYVRAVLAPCLRAAGYLVPPLPSAEQFRDSWATDSAFDAYALIGSPSEVIRARTACPSAEFVVQRGTP